MLRLGKEFTRDERERRVDEVVNFVSQQNKIVENLNFEIILVKFKKN